MCEASGTECARARSARKKRPQTSMRDVRDTGADGMVNISESLINVVSNDKLIRIEELEPKRYGQGYGDSEDPIHRPKSRRIGGT